VRKCVHSLAVPACTLVLDCVLKYCMHDSQYLAVPACTVVCSQVFLEVSRSVSSMVQNVLDVRAVIIVIGLYI
jgi:hypothetical protein